MRCLAGSQVLSARSRPKLPPALGKHFGHQHILGATPLVKPQQDLFGLNTSTLSPAFRSSFLSWFESKLVVRLLVLHSTDIVISPWPPAGLSASPAFVCVANHFLLDLVNLKKGLLDTPLQWDYANHSG